MKDNIIIWSCKSPYYKDGPITIIENKCAAPTELTLFDDTENIWKVVSQEEVFYLRQSPFLIGFLSYRVTFPAFVDDYDGKGNSARFETKQDLEKFFESFFRKFPPSRQLRRLFSQDKNLV